MDKKEKLLVLAPHTDDETLGCGGLIAKTIEEGGEVFILVFTMNYGNIDYKEFGEAIKILGASGKNCYYTDFASQTLKLDQIEIKTLITEIENICNKIKPTTVALPFVQGFHQDHEAIGKAAIVALRPHGYLPKKVLVYEQPYYGSWGIGTFQPNYYVDIGKHLGKKLSALKAYRSQKIPFEMVKSMANMRGAESHMKYAEAYMLMRAIA